MSIKIKIAGQEYTVDGAAEEDTLLRIESLFKKAMNTSGSVFDPKAQQNFAKAMKDSTKSSDDLGDSFDDLNNTVEDADKSFDDVVKHEKDREKQREASMNDFKKAVATNIVATSQYFAHSVQDAAHSLIDSLSHASSPEDGVMAFAKVIDTTINVISDGIKAIASAIPVIGTAVAGLTGAAAESAKFLNDFVASQLVNIIQSYGKISAEGILLAGGMSQLKETANNAGVGIQDFSDALSRNAEMIGRTGLGMTAGAEKFGKAITAITTGYSDKLFALGYNFQDQADIVAASMANLSKTTNIQKMSGDQIAQQSYEYAKSLKVISDITGRTAKQQIEAQQKAQLNIAVQAKLAEQGPEAAKKFNQMMSVLPEAQQQAAEEYLIFGKTITGGMAVLAAQNTQVANAVAYSTNVLNDSSVSAAEASKNVVGLYADARDSLKTDPRAIPEAIAGFVGVGGKAGEVSASIGQMQTDLQNFTKSGIGAAAKAANDLTEKTDPMTKQFAELSKSVLQFKSMIETDATGAVKEYSNMIHDTLTWLKPLLDESKKHFGDNAKNSVAENTPTDKTTGLFDQLLTTLKNYFSTNEKANIAAGNTGGTGAAPVDVPIGYAMGGIASGPTSGFTTTLHGTEAIVPLPDGRSIPVDINTDDLKRDNETRNSNAEHRNDLVDEKMLATLQALLNTQEDGNYYSKQNAGMSNAQNNLLKNLVDQMTLNNELLSKIYKTSY